MRRLGLLVSTILLLAPLARAQGLPSANDPRIFAEAICLTYPDGGCPALVALPTARPDLWYYTVLYAGRHFTFEPYMGDGRLPSEVGVTRLACLGCLGDTWLEVSVEAEGNRELRQYGIFTRPDGEFDRPAHDGAVGSDWATATITHGPSTITPEPASMILLGSGLAGLAAIRKRRRSRGAVSGLRFSEGPSAARLSGGSRPWTRCGSADEEPARAQILVDLGPMDALTVRDQLPSGTLLRGSALQAPGP